MIFVFYHPLSNKYSSQEKQIELRFIYMNKTEMGQVF